MEKDRGLECTLAAPNNDDVLVAELFKIALLGCVGHEFRRKFLKQTWPMRERLDTGCDDDSPCLERVTVLKRQLVPVWTGVELTDLARVRAL